MTLPERNSPTMRAADRGAPKLAPRLFEQVAVALKDEISSGAIDVGSVLRESVVAERFGVSRAPVRMALATLEKEGLLTLDQGMRRVAARPAGSYSPGAIATPTISAEAAWERIYAEVETELVARMSFGSWRVVESDLAKHFGVSRTVAREVLGRLQQRGVVKKDRRAHWFVPELGPDYVGDLYEMRWTLEPAALMNAAPYLPPDIVSRSLANIDGAMAQPDIVDGAMLDGLEKELHIDILGHCKNKAMTEAIRLYQSLLVAHGFLYKTAPKVFPSEPFLPEHRDVLEKLSSGHPREAASALRDHLHVSRDRAVYRIQVVRKLVSPATISYAMPIK